MKKVKINECQNVQIQLSAYIDKELPSWKRHFFRWHLKRCAICDKKYKELEQVNIFLHSVETVKTSEGFLSNVMSRANSMNISQNESRSVLNRIGSIVDGLQIWMRRNIRAYNSLYIGGFIVGVILMIGVTLYPPKIDNINLFSQLNTKTIQEQQERLVAFEVILQQEPKRTLKIR